MTITGTATSGNDTLTSNTAADTISGQAGDDTIDGGGGNDIIYGDTSIVSNPGFDSAQAASAYGNLAVTGWTNAVTGGIFETWGNGFINTFTDDGSSYIELDTYSGASYFDSISTNVQLDTGKTYTLDIESASRDATSDSFQVLHNGVVIATITPATIGYFSSTMLTVTGVAGTDTITIREMSAQNSAAGPLLNGVTISPTAATVAATGLSYNDNLFGGLGNDRIYGQEGNDRIEGGAGDDYLVGGIGDDVFVVNDGQGTDKIKDFTINEDLLDISAIHDANGGKVTWKEVVVTSDSQGGSILTFPNGEKLVLRSVAPSSLDTKEEMANIGIACFAQDTLILTADGEREIQNLRAGDLVMTLDRGLQPVMWIGSREVEADAHLAPIAFKTGAIGNTKPLLVSPLHRMLISDWRSKVMFDADEILVTAKSLVNGDTIFVSPRPRITYYHMMFDQHQIVFSNGVPSESFFAGKTSMDALEAHVANEILEIFPELRENLDNFGDYARKIADHHESVLAAKLGMSAH